MLAICCWTTPFVFVSNGAVTARSQDRWNPQIPSAWCHLLTEDLQTEIRWSKQ
jgi:hypothetical protein